MEEERDFLGVESDIDDEFVDGSPLPDIDDAVLFLSEEEQEELRLSVREVVQQIDGSIMELGGLLYRVFASKAYEAYGWETFPEYCEHEVGRKERYCRYLMSIWYGLTYKITDEDHKAAILDLGFSKAARLIPHINDANVGEVLKDVEGMTVSEVEGYIKSTKKGEKGDVDESDPIVKFSIDMLKSQKETLQVAMRVAKEITGHVSPGHQISIIATEFMAGHSEAGTAKAELVAAHITALKSLTGSDYAPSIDIPMLEGMMLRAIDNPLLVRDRIKSAVKGPLTLKEFIIFMGSGEHESLVDGGKGEESEDEDGADEVSEETT